MFLGSLERPFFDQNVKHQPPRHTPFSAQKRGREFRHFRVWKKANPHGVLVFLVVTLLFCDLFWFHCFSPIPTVCGRIGAIFSVLFLAICLNLNMEFLKNPLKTSSGSALGRPRAPQMHRMPCGLAFFGMLLHMCFLIVF